MGGGFGLGLWRPFCALIVTTVFASTTNAQTSLHSAAPIAIQTPYTELAQELNGRLDFEDLPVAPEPGHSYDQILAGPGVQIGEHLSGQAGKTSRWRIMRASAPMPSSRLVQKGLPISQAEGKVP